VSELLPLFPLASVLFPGEPKALCAFGERQRHMVHDIFGKPESAGPHRIGVIAIREGRETGPDSGRTLYEIGCMATLRQARTHGEGRFVLVASGVQRFQLNRLDHSLPYLRGEVDLPGEHTGEHGAARLMAIAVQRAFHRYLDALTGPGTGGPPVPLADQSDDPIGLSYEVAQTLMADLPVKQSLLAEPDALRRLTAERALLTRETTLLRTLASVPVPAFWHKRYHPN
jgi:uncharacterized protein